MERELIFGLDIGTRTVIGMAGYKEGKKWKIVESVCMEHQDRAMMDGQIHDIKKVEVIVRQVKNELENILGTKLKKVAIAAAGRVLTTQITQVEQVLEEPKEITVEDIQRLELLAIEKAKEYLEKDKKRYSLDYLCVAYTVTHYYLDDYLIANLEGHTAEKIGTQILATFLPRGVIESLYTVTERIDLEVSHLTLEPIAAMNAVIPESLRLLNLALVDVGAGTSDIALSKDGSIVAYGMIPSAGDEVTEAIVHKYLVDFNTAEQIKQSLGTQEIIEFQDIIGLVHTVAREEIVEHIKPSVQELAVQVAKNIIKLNGKKAPNAVFCVGGGSQMPGFTEKLAEELGLAYERVAVRTMDHVQNIELAEGISRGPQMITPTGICITAYENTHRQLTQVTVNDNSVLLMKTKKLTMMDVLLAHGVSHTEIFQTNGTALMFSVNGERIRVRGDMGQPAIIRRDGEDLTLESTVTDGDNITFEPAVAGRNGYARIFDYIKEDWKKTVVYNGEYIDLPLMLINGEVIRNREQEIMKGDKVEIYPVITVEDFIEILQLEVPAEDLYINDEIASLEIVLRDFDKVDYKLNYLANRVKELEEKEIRQKQLEEKEALEKQAIEEEAVKEVSKADEIKEDETIQEVLEQKELQEEQVEEVSKEKQLTIDDTVQETAQTQSVQTTSQYYPSIQQQNVHYNHQEEQGIEVVVNGKKIFIERKSTPYMLVDVFDYIDFDLTVPKGTVRILNNEKDAEVSDLITQGDCIDIYWEK